MDQENAGHSMSIIFFMYGDLHFIVKICEIHNIIWSSYMIAQSLPVKLGMLSNFRHCTYTLSSFDCSHT